MTPEEPKHPKARVQREKDAKAGRLDEVKLVMAQERQAEEEYRQQVGSFLFLFCFPFGFGGLWLDRNQQQKKTATTTNLKGEGIRGDALRWWARGVEAVIGDEFFWIKGWFPPQNHAIEKNVVSLGSSCKTSGINFCKKRGSTYYRYRGKSKVFWWSSSPLIRAVLQYGDLRWESWTGRSSNQEEKGWWIYLDARTAHLADGWLFWGGNWGVGRWGLEDESGEEEGTIYDVR